MKTQSQNDPLPRLAVPYYGRLITPKLGLSPVFFVADIDPDASRINFIDVMVWDFRQQPSLAGWLKKQGVNGLLCSDPQPHNLEELMQEGLWVRANEAGEAMEMLERWASLAGEPSIPSDFTSTQSRSAA